METSGQAASVALLAVVIPVYAQTVEHVALLQRALQHLAQQRGCQATHIVLVDDASPLALATDYAGSGEVLFSQPGFPCICACIVLAGSASPLCLAQTTLAAIKVLLLSIPYANCWWYQSLPGTCQGQQPWPAVNR